MGESDIGSGTLLFGSQSAVFTSHGTVLFVDTTSGELRHGLPHVNPSNVALLREGDQVRIRFVDKNSQRDIAFLSDSTAFVRAEQSPSQESSIAANVTFTRVPTFGKAFGLKQDGKFLSAEPDGRILLDRSHFRDWEQFHIRVDWSELSGTIVSQRIDGQMIHFFITNRKDWIQSHQCSGDFWEREALDIIRQYCIPERVFLDIGANIGNHALFVSKFCNVAGITVFEPNPIAVKILQTNLALNNCLNVDTHYLGFALGSEPKSLRVFMPSQNNLGGSQMIEDASGTIRTIRGDEVMLSRPVGFIKIDVENMEFEVLDGLRQTIERWRPNIFIEVHSQARKRLDTWRDQLRYDIRNTLPHDNYLLLPR